MRCSVVFGVTLRLYVINILSSSPAINTAAYYQRCVITSETVAVVHRRPCLQHLASCSVNTGSQARYRLRIAISAYPTCIRRPHYGGSRWTITMPFGTEELEWRGYPMAKKFYNMFIRFDTTHKRDRHNTDRQTDTAWRHRPRLYIASCDKNSWHIWQKLKRLLSCGWILSQ